MSDREKAIRKAAILIASLDRQTADAFLDRLPAPEAASIRDELLTLSPQELASEAVVIQEFLALAATDELPPGLPSGTEDVAFAFPDSPHVGMPLHEASAAAIALQLRSERPQTIASAVSKLSPDKAARVLAEFDRSQQVSVIDRLIELRISHAVAIDDVCDELETALNRKSPGNDALFCQQVLSHLIGHTGGSTAEHLRQKKRTLEAETGTGRAGISPADEGRVTSSPRQDPSRRAAARADDDAASAAFQELKDLDNAVLASVLRDCDANDLLVALGGANREFLGRLQSCLTPHEAIELEERVRQQGPIRVADAQAAQQRLIASARLPG